MDGNEILSRMLGLLAQVPPGDRQRFARGQLLGRAPALVELFDSRPASGWRRTVLYLAPQVHSREVRLAAAAAAAGWETLLVCGQTLSEQDATAFSFVHVLADSLTQLLASWAFPGRLMHVFVLRGDYAYLPLVLKNKRTIVDIYDTGSGMLSTPPALVQMEREVLAAADAITHRDLRVRYLRRFHNYKIPKSGLFIHDPIQAPLTRTPEWPRTDDIHIVSVGWIGTGDNGSLETCKVFCSHGIHVHVHFSAMQGRDHSDARAYWELQDQTPFFHIEPTVSGEAYWAKLRRYDFGMSISDRYTDDLPLINYTRDYVEGCGSSRVSDYIRSGLGIILSPRIRFQHFWARRFGPCLLTADRPFMDNPRPVLEQAKASLQPKPEPVLSRITIEGVSLRLGRFYERLSSGGA